AYRSRPRTPPLALLTPDFATRRHIGAYFAERRVTPRIAMETNSIHALTEIVRHTPLATVLPDAITHQHPHLSPAALPPPSPPPKHPPLPPVAPDPPFPPRPATRLPREGAYQTAANRAFTHLTHEFVRTH